MKNRLASLALALMLSSLVAFSASLLFAPVAFADGGGGGGGDGGDGDGDGGDGDGDGGDGDGDGGDGDGDGGDGDVDEVDIVDYFLSDEDLPQLLIHASNTRPLSQEEENSYLQNGWGTTPLAINVAPKPVPVSALRIVRSELKAVDESDDALPTSLASLPRHNPLDEIEFKRIYQETEHDIAVIISNRNYAKNKGGVPDNDPAHIDAEAFSRFAQAGLGIRPGNILSLRDASQAQLLRVFGSSENPKGQLHDWVKPNQSRVYVYYAGHGAPAEDEDGFLVPIDADGSRLSLNGYRISTLYDNLAQLPAKNTWLVLESCFSGVSQNGPIMKNASPIYVKPTLLAPPKGLTVISAAQADQVASWSEDGQYSLFTEHFLKAMSGKADQSPYGNGDDRVELPELRAYLKDNLSYWSRRYYGRDQVAEIYGEAL